MPQNGAGSTASRAIDIPCAACKRSTWNNHAKDCALGKSNFDWLLRKNRNAVARIDCYITAALRRGTAFTDNDADEVIAIGYKRVIAPETYS